MQLCVNHCLIRAHINADELMTSTEKSWQTYEGVVSAILSDFTSKPSLEVYVGIQLNDQAPQFNSDNVCCPEH